MGTAWASALSYPWEQGLYVGGIETVKVNLALRIYSNKWHVYAGLAILNPSARTQIDQYAKSATELYKLMLEGPGGEGEKRLRERVEWGRTVVFGVDALKKKRKPILLSEDVLDKFSLGRRPTPPVSADSQNDEPPSPATPTRLPKANSHLSLLAMVDCWAHLEIKPFLHLSLAATPIFRLFLGVAEYLFLSPQLLSSALHSALHDTWHRSDDLEFVIAARGWSQCVSFGSFEVYRRRFEETRGFFDGRFEEAGVLGSEMIKAIMETSVEPEE